MPIPSVPGSILCPVTALKTMISTYPAGPNRPMFMVYDKHDNQSLVTLTACNVRQTLSNVLHQLGINPLHHGFHTFRRSAATLAFQSKIPLTTIQAQGTWSSDSVWRYIYNQNNAIPSSFKKLVSSMF